MAIMIFAYVLINTLFPNLINFHITKISNRL